MYGHGWDGDKVVDRLVLDSLIEKEFLTPERRHDQDAVEAAIDAFICYALCAAA